MRTTVRKGNVVMYSPDDGDYAGFVALLKQWTEGRAYRDKDLEDFAGEWARCSRCTVLRLRTQTEWLKELNRWLGRQQGR